MVKAIASLTARVIGVHRDMTPLINRIHTGFMVDRSIQAVEQELNTLREMLDEIRKTLKAPKTDSHNDYTLLK